MLTSSPVSSSGSPELTLISSEAFDSVSPHDEEMAELFDSLDRAFQLATGWTLDVRPVQNPGDGLKHPGQTELYINDLSELSFTARIGRRYADNLLVSINQIWARQFPADSLEAKAEQENSSAKNSVSKTKKEQADCIDKRESPVLTNFDIGQAKPKSGGETADWLARSDGKVAIVHSYCPPDKSNFDDLIIRLKTGFQCLGECATNPAQLYNQLNSLLWRLGDGNIATEFGISFVDDRSFECGLILPEKFSALILDAGLNSIEELVDPGKEPEDSMISIAPRWIGHGQMLLLSHSLDTESVLKSIKRLSKSKINSLSATKISELVGGFSCPTVIKRK